MAILPFRGLAERGILRDPAPFQLDMNAWSGGAGMRFHSNKAMRGPIWRGVGAPLAFRPQHCVGYRPSSGFDVVFLADEGGHLYKSISGITTDVAPAGYLPTATPAAFTSTFLGDVVYVTRPSDVPYYYGPASTAFAKLPGWDTTWRCRSMRAFGNYLIALNVTKGAAVTKTMVKWSDLTLAGQVPGSWDATDSTKNTGENILEDMDAPIVDGCPMRSNFIIYSSDQVWAMTPVATQEVFRFRRLFSEGGLIAPNCAVEVDGKHYVFGTQDIYVHDGTTKTSIIDQRNRDYVFRNLDMRRTEVCFASYMPTLNEIVFAYRTGDADSPFAGGDRCNKGAVYNIPGNTWTFIDLPNVSSISLSNLNTTMTYATAQARGLTYANVGGSYYDQDSGYDTHIIAVSADQPGKVSASRLVAYDFMNKGTLAYPFIPELNAPAYIERTGIDLDQVGSDLVTYKNVRRVYPLVSIFDKQPVLVQIGGSLTPSGIVTWSPAVSFDPATQYKVDVQKGGRYLAVRFTVATPCDFEIDGFDLDVSPGGRR